MTSIADLRALEGHRGKRIYTSEWFTIQQAEVDDFARLTGDWDRQHNDPESARGGPFGGTIVHGYLMVSLTAKYVKEAGIPVESSPTLRGLNYGMDKVRFPHHFLVGALARWHIDVIEYAETSERRIRMGLRNTIELQGVPKPAMVSDCIVMYFPGSADQQQPGA